MKRDVDGPHSSTWERHHQTIPDCESAVAAGCLICNYVFELGPFQQLVHQPDCRLLRAHFGGRGFRVSSECRCPGQWYRPEASFNWRWLVELPAVDRTVGSISGSSESISTVQEWARKCQATHTWCSRLQTPGWYPSRLLDLQAGNTQQSPTTRLILTAKQSMSGAYNTLSHCWGSKPFLCLSEETIVQFSEELPVSELTKTFQEAIDFTRRLGVRYLWIDSLCIVQDKYDPSDWLRESRFMDKIYGNGYINLSATASTDGTQGIYRSRHPSAIRPPVINYMHDDHEEHIQFEVSDYIEIALEDGPLHDRAWTHQERLVSPRTLHFTDQELIWECRELFASEKYPERIPLEFRGFSDPHLKPLALRPSDAKSGEEAMETMYERWWMIQEQFSEAQLTFPDDTVPAISGMAKLFEPLMKDIYVAGMWKNRLETELLWYVYPEKQRESERVRRRYYTPSFSWTSVSERISRYRPRAIPSDLTQKASILGLDLQYVSEDHTGYIKTAELRIKGRLRRVNIWAEGKRMHMGIAEERYKHGGWFWSDHPQENILWSSKGKQHFTLALGEWPLSAQFSANIHPFEFELSNCYGLVLELLNESMKQYRRIGFFTDGRTEYIQDGYDPEADIHTICIV